MQQRFTQSLLFLVLFSISLPLAAQVPQIGNGTVRGSFQSDAQWYFPDARISAQTVDERIAANSFLQLTFQKGNFSAGIRYEAYQNPLLGFRAEYEGQGIPYRFASFTSDKIDLTVGNFYDQFGSGMVFRTYQEWTLGIDNSIDGIRVAFRPSKGIYTKAFIGKMRRFWGQNAALIRGADGEIAFHEIFPSMAKKKWQISLGASIVSKYLEDDNTTLVLPENVSTYGARLNVTKGKFSINTEYAHKINDPFKGNDFRYDPGNGFLLTTGYSQKGLGVTATLKRIDNMDSRAERNPIIEESTINYLPPTTLQHTYRLPTLYPYATQPGGEFGGQIDFVYTFKRKSALGGKYGMTVYMNYSRIYGLNRTVTDSSDGKIYRTKTDFGPDTDQLWFEDFSVEITRKMSKKLKLNFNYINMLYDKQLIEEGIPMSGIPPIRVNAFILETTHKISRKVNLRTESQLMLTSQERDLGDWAMLLGEVSVSPNWIFTVWDEWNYGGITPESKVGLIGNRAHYLNINAAYVYDATRISIGFGRQRAGLLCVGGICRVVPATSGFRFSINTTF
ncbi:MAG: DUF6029 family protein [Bacteroidia bacterium]